eukprot:TRINITY_DN86320_c0_g1_i1.p1 TRINITY_DN86320_c0_g1~~TRINITY_DN86320_c0_g1_i1.p1  ORF type:complete len:329 (+),score=14.39 TRINITY_DN86320_c0_g1_i1:56-1042(+)
MTLQRLPDSLIDLIDDFMQKQKKGLGLTCKQYWSLVGGKWTANINKGFCPFIPAPTLTKCPHKAKLRLLWLDLTMDVDKELKPLEDCHAVQQLALRLGDKAKGTVHKAGGILRSLTNLVYLDFIGADPPAWVLAGLHNKPNLTRLDFIICRSKPAAATFSTILSNRPFPALRHIRMDMHACTLSAQLFGKNLLSANLGKQLEILELEISTAPTMTTQAVHNFANAVLAKMANLRKLDLSLSELKNMQDPAVKSVCNVLVTRLTQLQTLRLDLAFNKALTAVTLTHLTTLASCQVAKLTVVVPPCLEDEIGYLKELYTAAIPTVGVYMC